MTPAIIGLLTVAFILARLFRSTGMWWKLVFAIMAGLLVGILSKEVVKSDNDNNCLQVSSSADSSPEDLYIYHETDSKLSDALNRLRYKYRYILELRTVQNLSYKEIAEHLELSESQVKSRLNKAREKLKQLLN